MSVQIHTSAIVDKGAIIGDNTKVWHWTHISAGAVIGNDCSLGQNVYVANNVVMGNNVKVQNNVSIYDNVILENDVFCGPSMVFTNVYNPRSHVSRKNEYQNTIVRRGATIGANATIICGIEIGEYAFIGAGAVVRNNVTAYSIVVGVPGHQIGWISRYGIKLDLPLFGSGQTKCPETGEIYVLNKGAVTCLIA